MSLDLFYITNDPKVALIAEKNGVDRIWIDLETVGKEKRQAGMKTVKSKHRIEDIAIIKPLLTSSEMLVRVNPVYPGSKAEIDAVIDAGADIIMLPYWKTEGEVKSFLRMVGGRCRTSLLLETKEAADCVDEILKLDFDEIHIGLNDLHLSRGMTFMFELLADGTVEMLCEKFREKGIPYGFGGIAKIGYGLLPSEKVVMEHYRLGSTRAILSRSFCNIDDHKCDDGITTDYEAVEQIFAENMKKLRECEICCEKAGSEEKEENRKEVERLVYKIKKSIEENRK